MLAFGPISRKSAPGGEHDRGLVHHALVRDVAVGEDDLVRRQLADQARQLRLGMDRDALRVARPRQLGRIAAAIDVGDLRGGEGHHLGRRIVAEVRC